MIEKRGLKVLLVFAGALFVLALFSCFASSETLNGATIDGNSVADGSATASTTNGFDLNSLLLKASVIKGESVTKILTISKGHGQKVNLEVVGLKGINLSEKSFVLDDSSVKNIQVKFDSASLTAGVYAGSIKIYDDKDKYFLPVIFEVEPKDVFYDVNLDISPQYSTISPGGKLVAQVKIFDLTSGGTSEGLGRNSVTLEYNVRNVKGESISTETENVVVERQTQITKAITFPKNIEYGDYVFSASVKYKSSVGVASYLFNIGGEEGEGISKSFLAGFDLNFVIIIIVIVAFFIGIIFLFLYVIKDRDSIILEMKRFNEEEFTRQREFILQQERLMKQKGGDERIIKKQKRQKLDKIERNYKERKDKINKIGKKGNEKEMQSQLMQWKKQGYNTMGMEYKMKGLSNKEMKSLLGMWKKQYKGK